MDEILASIRKSLSEQSTDVLTVLSSAPFFGGSQESHVPHALLHLKPEILQDGG
jgi:hypothetical protein